MYKDYTINTMLAKPEFYYIIRNKASCRRHSMANISELKLHAQEQLRGKYWLGFLVCLIVGLIPNVGTVTVGGIDINVNINIAVTRLTGGGGIAWPYLLLLGLVFQLLITLPTTVGRDYYFLRASTSVGKVSDILFAFGSGAYLNIILVMAIKQIIILAAFAPAILVLTFTAAISSTNIFLLLIAVAFVIFALWVNYCFRMLHFVLAESPKMPLRSVLSKSLEISRERRWLMFKLDFSFIGWYLLGALACGVGVLFVVPYHSATVVLLYLELRNSDDPNLAQPANNL